MLIGPLTSQVVSLCECMYAFRFSHSVQCPDNTDACYLICIITYHVFSVSDDHSRVVLSLQDNTPGSDYINASYIDVSD